MGLDEFAGQFQRLLDERRSAVRDIHQHAQPVARGDDPPPESGQPAVHRPLRGDVAQLRNAVVNELQVNDAGRARRLQPLEITFEEIAALRREHDDLRVGDVVDAGSYDNVWMYRRGERMLVVLHLGPELVSIPMPGPGRVLLDTHRTRDAECFSRSVEIEGWRGLLVALD